MATHVCSSIAEVTRPIFVPSRELRSQIFARTAPARRAARAASRRRLNQSSAVFADDAPARRPTCSGAATRPRARASARGWRAYSESPSRPTDSLLAPAQRLGRCAARRARRPRRSGRRRMRSWCASWRLVGSTSDASDASLAPCPAPIASHTSTISRARSRSRALRAGWDSRPRYSPRASARTAGASRSRCLSLTRSRSRA